MLVCNFPVLKYWSFKYNITYTCQLSTAFLFGVCGLRLTWEAHCGYNSLHKYDITIHFCLYFRGHSNKNFLVLNRNGSLHWSISLKFCSFLYNGVCWDLLKLSVSDVIVKKVPMEKDSYISLGRTIILLAFFARKWIFGPRYILGWSSDPVSHFRKHIKYKK